MLLSELRTEFIFYNAIILDKFDSFGQLIFPGVVDFP